MLAGTVQSLFSELAVQEHVHYKRADGEAQPRLCANLVKSRG